MPLAKQRRGLCITKTKMHCLWDLWPNVRVGGLRGSHFGKIKTKAARGERQFWREPVWYVLVFGKARCDGF